MTKFTIERQKSERDLKRGFKVQIIYYYYQSNYYQTMSIKKKNVTFHLRKTRREAKEAIIETVALAYQLAYYYLFIYCCLRIKTIVTNQRKRERERETNKDIQLASYRQIRDLTKFYFYSSFYFSLQQIILISPSHLGSELVLFSHIHTDKGQVER